LRMTAIRRRIFANAPWLQSAKKISRIFKALHRYARHFKYALRNIPHDRIGAAMRIALSRPQNRHPAGRGYPIEACDRGAGLQLACTPQWGQSNPKAGHLAECRLSQSLLRSIG
jgi:hypothetical protein